jgi:hypothetical protein
VSMRAQADIQALSCPRILRHLVGLPLGPVQLLLGGLREGVWAADHDLQMESRGGGGRGKGAVTSAEPEVLSTHLPGMAIRLDQA